MEINLRDAVAAPFGNDHALGPMMVWPPANPFTDSARAAFPSAAQAAAAASQAICLPDLSGENPFA
jgi:hypothetical protein